MNSAYLNALIGGLIIGLATVLMMHLNGRIAGVSGIVNGIFKYIRQDWAWRVFFVAGLIIGGLVMRNFYPEGLADTSSTPWTTLVAAGLLVGFGTIMGTGCTSGHGVCGLSRLSIRSIVATLTFIGTGMLTLAIKHFLFS